MKISKQIWIDHQVKWNVIRKRELCKHNCYKGHAYVVCTSPHDHLLFEIVEASFLSSHYDQATVLALCHSKQEAVMQIKRIIDAIYNQKTMTYTQL